MLHAGNRASLHEAAESWEQWASLDGVRYPAFTSEVRPLPVRPRAGKSDGERRGVSPPVLPSALRPRRPTLAWHCVGRRACQCVWNGSPCWHPGRGAVCYGTGSGGVATSSRNRRLMASHTSGVRERRHMESFVYPVARAWHDFWLRTPPGCGPYCDRSGVTLGREEGRGGGLGNLRLACSPASAWHRGALELNSRTHRGLRRRGRRGSSAPLRVLAVNPGPVPIRDQKWMAPYFSLISFPIDRCWLSCVP
jgi:hypothetical protein